MSVNLDGLAGEVRTLNEAWEGHKDAFREIQKEVKKFGEADPLIQDRMTKQDETVTELQTKMTEIATAVELMSRKKEVSADPKDERNMKSWAHGVEQCLPMYGIKAQDWDMDLNHKYRAAFDALLRKNLVMSQLGPDEQKLMQVGSDPDGGYLVPDDMTGRMVEKVYEETPIYAYADVTSTSLSEKVGTYDNDELSFGWTGELSTRSVTGTPQVGQWRIPVHEAYAMPEVTNNALDDSVLDLDRWLEGKAVNRFSRAIGEACVNGNTGVEPRGFLTYSNSTDLTVGIEQLNTGVNGGFAATPDGMAIFDDAEAALKNAYKRNARYYMNRTVQAAIRKLRDSEGQPFWIPSYQAGVNARIRGYEVVEFPDMPDIGIGSLSIAFGDLRAAYLIVERHGLRLLRDPFTVKGRTLFYFTRRVGGGLINGESMKLIVFSA
jgi:HK97 family phage major capsid protein